MELDVGDNKDPQSGILHLPDELLQSIYKILDLNLDQESFGLTCHCFLYIQSSSHKTLELDCSSSASINIDSAAVDKLLNRFRQLQSLSLSGRENISDSSLTKLQHYGSNLHSLYLDDCREAVTDVGISYIASGCPSLSVISLARCSTIKDSGLEILSESCKSLTEVNLASCVRITDRGIWALSQNCRKLRALKISQCDKIVGVSFQGCSPTLTCLEADNCAFDPMGVTGILSGGGLEYLNLSCLHKCSRGDGFIAIGLGIGANLRILDLSTCSFVTDDVISRISKGCPLLEEWNLSGCTEVDYSGWVSIGLHCRNLVRLHVNGCEKLDDRGLLALLKNCNRLQVIYLTKCTSNITRSGIRIFKKRRKGVEIKKEQVTQITPCWAFIT
ncbi:hypothetical protein Lser_V15G16215 [Lactuca serriola]